MNPPEEAHAGAGPPAVGTVDLGTGLVRGVRYVASPNCDERPPGAVPEVLVVHAISLPPGEFGGPGVEQLFCNTLPVRGHPHYQSIADLRVSAHLFVRRDGDIVQFVPLDRRAWHAGQSVCEGRTGVNDFSIGIELEGTGDRPFEDAQYEVLARLTRAVRGVYPAITRARIYGHSDVAPGRKTDPGPSFDWTRYLGAVT